MRYTRYALLGFALCLLLDALQSPALALSRHAGGRYAPSYYSGGGRYAPSYYSGGGGYTPNYYSGAREGPGPRAVNSGGGR
jgi:hypothetical protein